MKANELHMLKLVVYVELKMCSNESTDLRRLNGLQDEASREGDSGVTVYNKG